MCWERFRWVQCVRVSVQRSIDSLSPSPFPAANSFAFSFRRFADNLHFITNDYFSKKLFQMERQAESDVDLEDDDDSVTVTIDNTNAQLDSSGETSTPVRSVPPPYDLVSQRIPYVWVSSGDRRSDTDRERDRLRLILEQQERNAQTVYEERRDEARRQAAANEEKDRVFRKARYETGFHVDTWPPTSVAARLFVRTVGEKVRLFCEESQFPASWHHWWRQNLPYCWADQQVPSPQKTYTRRDWRSVLFADDSWCFILQTAL